MTGFFLVFFILTNGTPEVLSAEFYKTKTDCEQALDFADFREPYLTLKAENPELKLECWEESRE